MDIREIVKEQINALSELDGLLDTEKEVLIKDRANEINIIIEKKKEIARKIAIVEKKRIELYGDKTIEDFLDDGAVDKNDFETLNELIFNIREKGETNLILTKQSINYIRTITSALNPNQRVVTYGNSGRVGDPAAKGVFTTKV